MPHQSKMIIGSEEWCAFSALKIPAVKARVDSGAKTSSLHAYNIQPFEQDGKEFVRFEVHPLQNNRSVSVVCEAELVARRHVKSSIGEKEQRHVIRTTVTMGSDSWEIEVTLTNRDSMGYRMLLGREAMRGRMLVDPEASFVTGERSDAEARSLYKMPKVKHDAGLKIALLASNPELYSNQRIMEAGQQRGHKMLFIDIKQCFMRLNASNPTVHYRGGEILKDVDAVIPRIRPAITFYGAAVTNQFAASGAFCLNSALSITRSRDKLRSLQLLVEHDIDIPITGFANSPQETEELIRMVGNAPLVIKLLEGTQGKGVVLAETNKAAESVINAFKSLNANILVQEFIKEADGADIRCFVIDGKVVGAMQRKAAEGEFRANLHLGGTASPIKVTAKERRIAIKAAKVMGLQVAGVDIIRSATGSKVLEINSSPGLEGIEAVTGTDIAGLMIQCIERHLK
jgi:ribosomal protein S6--L-glutamate ligase